MIKKKRYYKCYIQCSDSHRRSMGVGAQLYIHTDNYITFSKENWTLTSDNAGIGLRILIYFLYIYIK